MPAMTVGTGRALFRNHYHEKVLAMQPIAYWPLWEAAGTVARCLVNVAQSGTYSSNVATWPVGTGIGDGNTAPGFDGVNDYVNVQTAAFTAAFNGNTGTVFQWIRVANVGVWTDGTRRDSWFCQVDGANFVFLGRGVANNVYRFYYTSGGVNSFVNPGGLTTTAWVPIAISWNKPADEVKVYWNGAQVGATVGGLGIWAGALAISVIGATNLVPTNPFFGGIAHHQVYSRALSPTEIAALSTV